MKKNHTRNALIVLVALCIALYAAALSGQFKPTPDSSEYLGLSQSIADGAGFRFNDRPGTAFGPLLPWLGAAVISLTGWHCTAPPFIFTLKLFETFCAILFAEGSRRLFLRYLGNSSRGFWIYPLILMNLAVFQHCQFILSDIFHAAAAVWTLVLLTENSSWKQWIAGALCAALACLSRFTGIILILAVACWLILGRCPAWPISRRAARLALFLLLAAGPFALWKSQIENRPISYFAYCQHVSGFSGTPPQLLWDRFRDQIPVVMHRSAQILLNAELMILPLYVCGLLFTMLAALWLWFFLKNRTLTEWFAAGYMAVMLIWFDQGVRLFLPLLPVFLLYAAISLRLLSEGPQNIRTAAWGFLFLLLAALALAAFQNRHHLSPIDWLRGGYFYLAIFVVLAFHFATSRFRPNAPIPWGHTVPSTGFMVYAAIGILYAAGYGALEHNLVKQRGPMLLGYQPYVEAGLWLKDKNPPQPILCDTQSLLHLFSEKITSDIPYDQHSEDALWQRIRKKQDASIFWMENTASDNLNEGPANQSLGKIIRKNPNDFQVLDQAERPPWKYHLLTYRPAD